ncbi:MAG: MoaD/ThiS family protein [Spirochaetota bacterium]|nr:MAG: MoaD/ThiS family protein [Spirochaetota bacterium]
MKIKVTYVGFLKLEGIKNKSIVEIDEASTVSDLLNRCKVRESHQRFIVPIVNGKQKELSYMLQQDDDLFLHLPMGGG